MDSHQFCKFCADAKLLDEYSYTKPDAEILFREVKNVYLRKISIVEFLFALEEMAKRLGVDQSEVMEKAASLKQGPVFKTRTPAPRKNFGPERFFYDRKSFTGVHKNGGPTTVDKGQGGMITHISELCDRKPADKRGVKQYDDAHLRRSPNQKRSSIGDHGTVAYMKEGEWQQRDYERRARQAAAQQDHYSTPKRTMQKSDEISMRRRSLTGERVEFSSTQKPSDSAGIRAPMYG